VQGNGKLAIHLPDFMIQLIEDQIPRLSSKARCFCSEKHHERLPFLKRDILMYPHIGAMCRLGKSGELVWAVEGAGEFRVLGFKFRVVE